MVSLTSSIQADLKQQMLFLITAILQEFILPEVRKFSRTSGKLLGLIFQNTNRILVLSGKREARILLWHIHRPMQKLWQSLSQEALLSIRDRNVLRLHVLTFLLIY